MSAKIQQPGMVCMENKPKGLVTSVTSSVHCSIPMGVTRKLFHSYIQHSNHEPQEWFIVGTSKIVGHTTKKIHLKTSENFLHNYVTVFLG